MGSGPVAVDGFLVVGCWLLVALPCGAHGSTITVRDHPEPVNGEEVVYLAAPGERNNVELREVELGMPGSGVWEVRDSGAVITAVTTAQAQCTAIDAHTAQCHEVFLGLALAAIGRCWARRTTR